MDSKDIVFEDFNLSRFAAPSVPRFTGLVGEQQWFTSLCFCRWIDIRYDAFRKGLTKDDQVLYDKGVWNPLCPVFSWNEAGYEPFILV